MLVRLLGTVGMEMVQASVSIEPLSQDKLDGHPMPMVAEMAGSGTVCAIRLNIDYPIQIRVHFLEF